MDPKRTREALTGDLGDARAVVRWAVDLFVECQECGGFGFTWTHRTAISKSVKQPCPACEGRGFSLNQERYTRATGQDTIKAAILAYLLEGE